MGTLVRHRASRVTGPSRHLPAWPGGGADHRAAPARSKTSFANFGLTVEVVSDYGALLALREEWNSLVTEAGIDHPFLRHEWICTWWECFGAGGTLYVLLVRDGARLVGIAPLMRSEERLVGFRVRRLGSLCNLHKPRFDFIVAPGNDRVYRGIWRHLLSVAAEWDVLQLSHLLTDSRTFGSLSHHAREDGCAVGVWQGEQSPYLPLGGTWERYLEYEFLGANETWKLDWTPLTRQHVWLYVFAPGWRTRLLYLAKFRWLALLKRRRLYRRLRDVVFTRACLAAGAGRC